MIDEKLSAFLDGEASKDDVLEVLQRIRREPGLRALLDRHHLARACLRGEAHPGLDSGFADRVMAGIAAEETAEKLRSTQTATPTRRHFRTLVGLAMAASVAGFAVIALQSFPLHDSLFTPTQQTAANNPADAGSLAVADVQPGSTDASGQAVRWEQLPADAADQLNNYLISHNNYATDHGLGGSLGFMRVTAYDSDEDTQPNR